MDEWQSKALATFPELKREITSGQGGPLDLWATVFSTIIAAYRVTPRNDDFIRRAYEYAAWCVRQPETGTLETDLPNAAAIGFLENLPLDPRVSSDLHRWLSVETFEGCETLFRHHLSPGEYRKLHDEFIRKKKDVTDPAIL